MSRTRIPANGKVPESAAAVAKRLDRELVVTLPSGSRLAIHRIRCRGRCDDILNCPSKLAGACVEKCQEHGPT